VAEGISDNAWVSDLSAGLSVVALAQLLELWNEIAEMQLVEGRDDCFQWIWTPSKCYSTKTAYLAFFESRVRWPLKDEIWKCKAP
jgi:hypothetical protein